MNLKRIFGALLTVLGIIVLIYIAILFINNKNNSIDLKALIIYITISLIFFIAGIGLINKTKDEI
jgi:predicted Na+-dependent transporter